jgi:hypothetical protein
VPFVTVRKTWRNTSQPMCGLSGFFEQLVPLIRALNQKLPPERRLRVLAGDPPIDWERAKSAQETFMDRDESIASVIEREVLAKHRKALMLFGAFHIMHSMARPLYIKRIIRTSRMSSPSSAFLIRDVSTLSASPFASWPIPSLAGARGTWLGALDISQIFSPLIRMDKECHVQRDPFNEWHKSIESRIDAFLALNEDYMTELQRRAALQGLPFMFGRPSHQQIVAGAEDPLFRLPKQLHEDEQPLVQSCLEHQSHDKAPP